MKRGIGIGALVVIGFLLWWVTRNQREARAAELLPGETYPTVPTESEYEKQHRVVPIAEYIEREIPVYNTIEEWEETHG